jgi:hypothetical protein
MTPPNRNGGGIDIDGLDLDGLADTRTNGHGTTGDDDEPQLAIDEDSVRDKRIKEILSRKQEAVETRKDARMAMTIGNATRSEAESAYRAVIEAFITAIQPLLHEGDGPHYWSEKEYGQLVLSPPGHASPDSSPHDNWILPDGTRIHHRPDTVEIEIVGLRDLFEIGDPIKATQEVHVERGHYGKEPETHVTTGQVPFGILDDMLIDLNNHIADVGIGIGTESQDTWTV